MKTLGYYNGKYDELELPPEAYGWQNMETAAYPVRAARQMCWKDWGQSWL